MTKTEHPEIPKTKTMKAPRSDAEESDKIKKITTKMMIVNALKELKSRKGTSLYAIKKYLEEEYQVNPDRSKYLIKKSIKTGIEDGTIIQVKGIGISGSFKLGKEEKVKKPKKKKVEKEAKPKSKKDETKKLKKKEKPSKGENEEKIKPKKKDGETKKAKMSKKSEPKKKTDRTGKEKPEKKIKENSKTEKKKTVTIVQTPAKKKSAIMKRKSIGSIIKPPKMKPKKI